MNADDFCEYCGWKMERPQHCDDACLFCDGQGCFVCSNPNCPLTKRLVEIGMGVVRKLLDRHKPAGESEKSK